MSELEHALDSRDSATETLRQWCVARQPVADAAIHAVREEARGETPKAVIDQLGAADVAAIHHRRVRLVCGGTTLSVADNWYRADALTPEMNETLDHSDRPFGQVVAGIGLHRRPLSNERLPIGSGYVLRRRAVLVNDKGQPFSVVVETYTAAVLSDRSAERR